MAKYKEKCIKLDNKLAYQQLVYLCSDEIHFCLYENGKEVFLGMGKFLGICATRHIIKMVSGTEIKEVQINDFCTDLKRALDTIDLQDWRLYGIANFSFGEIYIWFRLRQRE